MRVAITGATGMIGSALATALSAERHEIVVVSRSVNAARRMPAGANVAGVVAWDPDRGTLDAAALEGCDAVVHLAGETIFGLWTAKKKERIRESRVRGSELVAGTLARLNRPPAAFLSASGVNYYGHRPADVPIDESAPPGTGFLAEVCVAWEAATRAAADAGIRTVRMRQGVVLGRSGGMLKVILPLFRLGLGGRLGRGDQAFAWIALDDAVGAMLHILSTPDLAGPVNLVAPDPVTNAEFTRTLGRVLHRPTPFAAPAFALRLAPGGMADEIMLGGARVVPQRLRESGYRFAYAELEGALREAVGHRA